MSFAGFRGFPRELQVNVLECNITSNTDSAMRQAECYLWVQYGSKIYRGGGINPTFQDKMIVFELTGVARELTVVVAMNEGFASDDIVGTTTIPLDAVLEQGYGVFHCALQKTTNSCRGAIELKLRLQLNSIGAASASQYYPYNYYPYPSFPCPPANPIPYYHNYNHYVPTPPYPPPPGQKPLLETILSHGIESIDGIVNGFVGELFQNLYN